MTVATAPPVAAERTLADRFIAAIPLLSVFFWLCVVYAVEAWAHATPWLFTDELKLTQLARAIADTGHPARRGAGSGFQTLWTYLMAPAWLIGDTQRAYDTVKYLGVIVMTLTVFPTYAIARTVVGRWPAVFAAAASAAIPAAAYSAIIVEEPLAYPYSTFCLFLIVRALLRPTRWWIVGAAVASLIAPAVRGELLVLPVVFLLAALFLAWRGERLHGWRARWSRGDWIGLGALLVTVGIVFSAFLGRRWQEWLVSTGFYKSRMLDLGLNAAGALTIGLGVLPMVAGLAILWRAPRERPLYALSVFRSVLLASVLSFGLYTAVKAAFISTVFGTYSYERNLIYLAPLLLVGTAVWLERRAIHPNAVAVSGFFVLIVLLTTPYEIGQDLSYNSPGLAILQQANRYLVLDESGAKVGLVCILLFSIAVLIWVHLLRRAAVWLAVALGALVVAWNLTGEIAFASASNRTSDLFIQNIRRPTTWLDEHTHGAQTLYLGQQMFDQNGEWLLEFWNRSIAAVWSLDGTANPTGGPVLTPDVRGSDGVLFPSAQYPYVVEEQGIEVAGAQVATHLHRAGGHLEPWRLIRVEPPLRLRASVVGVFPDGWSGESSAYTRYSTVGGQVGRIRIIASREAWGGPNKTGHVTVRLGPIVIGPDKQPHVGQPMVVKRFAIHSKETKGVTLTAPGPSFRVEVTIDPTFSPRELVPSLTDSRQLGAVMRYVFLPPRNAAHK